MDCRLRVGLHGKDAPGRADGLGERRREDADAAVEVEDRLTRLRDQQFQGRVDEGGGSARMHLPESACRHLEVSRQSLSGNRFVHDRHGLTSHDGKRHDDGPAGGG